MSTINFTVGKLSNGNKWTIAFVAAVLFFIISLPFVYGVTNSLFGAIGVRTTTPGGPTIWGILIHAIVFMLLLRLILW